MSSCTSCGRYTAPTGVCPYCGTPQSGPVSIRVVKVVAVALATLGLAALWLAATRSEAPFVQIGQTDARMNLAFVQLSGRCSRPPTLNPESQTLSFWLEDETGEITILAYRNETSELIQRGAVPALGDHIEVAGTLRIQDGHQSLTIKAPELLKITRPAPPCVKLKGGALPL